MWMFDLRPALSLSNLKNTSILHFPWSLGRFPDNLCEVQFHICLLIPQMHWESSPDDKGAGSHFDLLNPWRKRVFLSLPLFLTFFRLLNNQGPFVFIVGSVSLISRQVKEHGYFSYRICSLSQPVTLISGALTCSMANCQYGCDVVKGQIRCQCPSPGLQLAPDGRTCVGEL